jgi:hypothetical protein
MLGICAAVAWRRRGRSAAYRQVQWARLGSNQTER